jgi:hypothetical protein
MDRITLALGALIVPQDSWTKDFSPRIKQDQPVHLPRQTNRPDSFPSDTCLLQDRLDTR